MRLLIGYNGHWKGNQEGYYGTGYKEVTRLSKGLSYTP